MSAALPRRRIAVVVTAYNYGHFLAPCLDSVLGQSRLPDEIVVIDDGSTDMTPEIMAGYTDRARYIRTENGGQAAAFNRGFAETTADLVLFLDADDLLLPHALETVLLHWSDDMAHLVFGLELIDSAGAGIGIHPALRRPPNADNRPELLLTGTFPFPPTSGNVFSRPMLEAALPMPEERWRISADCFLIRAAALFGRTGHVAQILGSYRIHFANNYTRLGQGGWDNGLRLQNRADVADALTDLAAARDALLGPDAATLRKALTLRAAAIRNHAEIDRGTGAPILPPEEFADILSSRFLPILELDTDYDLMGPAPALAGFVATDGACHLDLRLPVVTGPMTIALTLEPDWDGPVTIIMEGEPASRIETGERRVSISLAKRPFEADRRVRLTFQATGGKTPQPLGMVLSATRNWGAAPMIGEGPARAAYPLLGGSLDPADWSEGADGAVTLDRPDGTLRVSLPVPGPGILSLGLPADSASGWLSIDANGQRAFRGRTGSAMRIDLPILVPVEAGIDLSIGFRPDEDAPPLSITSLAYRPETEPPGTARFRMPVSIGEQVTFSAHPFGQAFLTHGWAFDGTSAPETRAAEAGLMFVVPPTAEALSLTVSVAPLLYLPEGQSTLLGVSRHGEMLVTAQVDGEGEVTIPIYPVPANGIIILTFHAILSGQPDIQAAPVLLTSMSLEGRLSVPERPLARPPARVPAFQQIFDRAANVLNEPVDRPGRAGRLAACRAALVEQIAVSDVALPLLFAGSEARLSALVDLAEAARAIPPKTAEQDRLRAAEEDGTDRGRLVHTLLGILLLPAYRHPFAGDLSALPPPMLATPAALGAHLGAAPVLSTRAEHDGYRRYLLTLLTSVGDALEAGRDNGPLFKLADATLHRLRAVRTIFADGNVRELVELQSAAIERSLAASGAALSMPRTVRPGVRRLRLGVLVRDVTATPEGWALRGMYDGLDPERLDLVLIRVDDQGEETPDVFSETLCLAGFSVPQAVRAIRGLDLDIFVTGAYARDYETVSAIYAHRLAPLQLWHAAVCPTTGGFASFDGAISCRASEPADAEAQYTEPLHWIEGPKQCAYAFDPPMAVDRAALRAELGVPDGAVLLVSSAMAHKIDDVLLAHWARILSEAPDAFLVLAPFAPNWSMAYDRDAFEARVLQAGIPEARVSILPAMPPHSLHALLAAADLMLDSFPYSGATTVCEALSRGTPVVTLAGSALRQLTGASWVRAYGLDELVADTEDDYVSIASELASAPEALVELRARCAATAAETPPPHDDRAGFGQAYSDALWSAAEKSGLFPGLGNDVKSRHARPPLPAPQRILSAAKPRILAMLASPRTGSTLLCAILNRTPGVLSHFELFHDDMIQYARETIKDPEAIAARNADPVGFLESLRTERIAEGTRIVAFKHFGYMNQKVTETVIRDRNFLLIHLSRENRLAQYSSDRIARATGKWVQHMKSNEQIQITFDPEDFDQYVRYRRSVEESRMNLFARSRRSPLFLDYQDLNSDETRDRLGEFIGISIPDSARPDIVKQNKPDILSRFSNPDEVTAYLAERGLSHWARED